MRDEMHGCHGNLRDPSGIFDNERLIRRIRKKCNNKASDVKHFDSPTESKRLRWHRIMNRCEGLAQCGGVSIRYFAKNFWNASCSMTTEPTARSFFRPSFCFSSSFRRLLRSLACSLARTSLRYGLIVARATMRLPALLVLVHSRHAVRTLGDLLQPV
jgi:hypothetical protein